MNKLWKQYLPVLVKNERPYIIFKFLMDLFIKCMAHLAIQLSREKPKIILAFPYLQVVLFFLKFRKNYFYCILLKCCDDPSSYQVVDFFFFFFSALNALRVLCISQWCFFWLLDRLEFKRTKRSCYKPRICDQRGCVIYPKSHCCDNKTGMRH